MKKKSKLKPITAERFERESLALIRLLNAGVINATTHKRKYDVLLKRIRMEEA